LDKEPDTRLREVICDTEWNGLEDPDKCWVIVCRDVQSDEVFVFERPDLNPQPFKDFAREVQLWIGHHFIQFDLPNLYRIGCGDCIESSRIYDTLVASRLVNYRLEGGHSVEAWAIRLKLKQQKEDIKDWSVYTKDILSRCISDTIINKEIYLYLKGFTDRNEFKDAFRLELDNDFICLSLRQTGFPFDKVRAEALKVDLTARLKEIDDQLISSFPSTIEIVKEFTPKVTLKGTLNSKDFRWLPKGADVSFFKPDVEYSLVSLRPFEPASLKQCIERLNEAGWQPTEKTKGHAEITSRKRKGKWGSDEPTDPDRLEHFSEYGWKLSEENLRTLPDTAPQAAFRLVERLLLASRVSDLEEWLALVRPSGRIHGTFNTIGAWTQRMSTARPNMQNIPVAKHSDKETEIEKLSNSINDEMRSCWIAEKNKRILGVDADGIQMRVFAHYVNDQRLIDALVRGDKKLKTDIHSLHQSLLGTSCLSRDDAKTFIYAWLLGAGVAKVAEILKCSHREAKQAVDNFILGYPGLAALKKTKIPADAARGYFSGLDKRLVVCYDEHRVLAGYLQNGEAIIMKRAARMFVKELNRRRLPFEFINFVHDEFQVMIPDSNDLALEISDIIVNTFPVVGEDLEMNCPLAGTVKIKDGFIGGYTWKDTH
jgi:DNA polymerase-1